MSEKDIVKAIIDHINRQGNNWKFVMGREILDKKSFLKKLSKDKEFRKTIVQMVVSLSVDILTRKGE
ncbi:MAG: hypothetical protein QXR44_03165 [Thermoproteota archaeon]